ncbi:MAG: hypothetical protein ACK52I_10685 [Pseudomonadota bacterium]
MPGRPPRELRAKKEKRGSGLDCVSRFTGTDRGALYALGAEYDLKDEDEQMQKKRRKCQLQLAGLAEKSEKQGLVFGACVIFG